MSIECFVISMAFRDGKRLRPGQKYTYSGDPEELPSYLVPRKEYQAPEPAAETDAGLVEKIDAIEDASIDGDGFVAGVSKAALKLAEEYSISIEDVTGTGAKGQVTKADVQRFLEDNTSEDVI